MRYGVNLNAYIAAEKQGRKVACLDEMPELPDELRLFWDAFCQLSKSRQIGFGPCAILLVEIETSARLHCIADVHEFIELMQAMDVVFLEHVIKQAKPQNADTGRSDKRERSAQRR